MNLAVGVMMMMIMKTIRGAKRMRVVSLFDGMSCGQLALDRLGIKPTYFASEIDKYAMQVTKANYPNTQFIGDVTKVDAKLLPKIDLLLGGSPCQGFSFAGKQLNFDDPRSKLFFEYVRLLKELKPKYFLLENVRMKKESQDIISEYLGVEPIAINSNLVSAQNRYRLYWTNIPNITQPKDKQINLKDIIEDGLTDRTKSHCIDANYFKGGNLKSYFEKHRRQLIFSDDGLCHVGDADLKGHGYVRRVYSPEGKAPSLCASSGGNLEPKILVKGARLVNRRLDENGKRKDYDKTIPNQPQIEVREDNNSNCLTTVTKDSILVEDMSWRKLTPLECERLQTVPDGYTKSVSNTQRYRMLGNGWTVDVISHILSNMEQSK
jgi:DNA (cytosine-5)-methyltransferase 3A